MIFTDINKYKSYLEEESEKLKSLGMTADDMLLFDPCGENPDMKTRSIAILGNFDGVHIGHAALIKHAQKMKKIFNEDKIVVWTFGNLNKSGGFLTTPEKKAQLLEELGADIVILDDFERISSLSPMMFVESVLKDELNARNVICGYNYHFGKDRSGDAQMLKQLCLACGLSCSVIYEVKVDKTGNSQDNSEGAANRLGNINAQPSGLSDLNAHPNGSDDLNVQPNGSDDLNAQPNGLSNITVQSNGFGNIATHPNSFGNINTQTNSFGAGFNSQSPMGYGFGPGGVNNAGATGANSYTGGFSGGFGGGYNGNEHSSSGYNAPSGMGYASSYGGAGNHGMGNGGSYGSGGNYNGGYDDSADSQKLTVSSSRIKEALIDGDIKTADMLLGRPFSVKAEVIRGRHAGTEKLMIPTINQRIPNGLAKIKPGVYASFIIADGEELPSVTDIGKHPTFGEGDEELIETHIISEGYNKELYGKEVEVFFLERLRDEMRFDSPDALAAEIRKNIASALDIYKDHKKS